MVPLPMKIEICKAHNPLLAQKIPYGEWGEDHQITRPIYIVDAD